MNTSCQYESWSEAVFSNRRTYNGRLTIGRSKEGLPLVGFKHQKADDWLDFNSKQEGVRLVGFKYQKDYDWLDLNSKQEGVRLLGFKYQKGYNWLDSKFHCSYLKSRGIPKKPREKREKTRDIISLSFPVSGSRLPVPVTSFPVISVMRSPPHSTPSNMTWMVHLYFFDRYRLVFAKQQQFRLVFIFPTK